MARRRWWLHHRELTDAGPALCRTENMVPHHGACGRCCARVALVDVAGALLGEPAVLYKDKLNYKLPGGAGYAAHQDAPAYRFVDVHVSCMVAIDDAGEANGCLEVVSGAHDRLWPTDDAGCIRADVVAVDGVGAVPVRAGDALWFHSRTPHRSGPNRRPGRGGRCTRHTTPARRATCGRTTTGRGRPSWPPSPPQAIGWPCRSSATSRVGRSGDDRRRGARPLRAAGGRSATTRRSASSTTRSRRRRWRPRAAPPTPSSPPRCCTTSGTCWRCAADRPGPTSARRPHSWLRCSRRR